MPRLISFLFAILSFASISSAQAARYQSVILGFDGPKVVLAGELKYPANSVAYGTVVVEAVIDEQATLKRQLSSAMFRRLPPRLLKR
jgi:hypothetical protein